MTTIERVVGAPVRRVEGVAKVTGEARYAAEFPLDRLAYGVPVQATIAKGRVVAVHADAVRELPGVLAVLTAANTPPWPSEAEAELQVLRDDVVHYRGQVVGLVVATSLELARAAADALAIDYDADPHDVVLTREHPGMYKPEKVNPNLETDTSVGDLQAGVAAGAVVVDEIYRTPAEHNHPMEPHATTAAWEGGRLVLHESTQGAARSAETLAGLFGLAKGDVRVISEHVGGGFGSKGTPRANAVLAALAARELDRPVRVVLSRPMLFSLIGYRTPTIQRVRLAADRAGELLAIGHDVWEQTSTLQEFAEQTATATRMMYAAPNRVTTHRLVSLDVPTPRWMRAPGECPGMFALESAMDELAERLGIDPVEVRLRNEPAVDPETGQQWSSRGLPECLRVGAEQFGWAGRDPRPGVRRDGRWLVGTGVASSVYPARTMRSTATARRLGGGRYLVQIAAADIGTGARTALTQLAADALGVTVDDVEVRIGDSDFGPAMIAGGSMGTASWSWAVHKACRELVDSGADEARGDTEHDIGARADRSRYAFGAQFAEVRVDSVSGEVRVPRMLGVFACGRIVNPRTARSQLVGGMTMGLSMALHEEGVVDVEFGDFANHDLASYHVATNADVGDLEATWIDEHDDDLNPDGIKGLGEIGIVGTAAAVTNAVWHATGVRVRNLPVHVEDLRR